MGFAGFATEISVVSGGAGGKSGDAEETVVPWSYSWVVLEVRCHGSLLRLWVHSLCRFGFLDWIIVDFVIGLGLV